VDNIL
jgi:hypothetical protein